MEGNEIIIPIFCVKPDISSKPINARIFFNDKEIYCFSIENNDLRYLRYDIGNLGYKVGDIVYIGFEVDSLWAPSEYGMSEDSRLLGVAVGRIEFVK